MKHHCGLFAIAGHPDAAYLTYLGLHAQQHRGEESAGICTVVDGSLSVTGGLGLVSEAIKDWDKNATAAIGHVRYSTTGSNCRKNIQPLLSSDRSLAIAHNGNLTNSSSLRTELSNLNTSSDTEIILRLFEAHYDRRDALMKLEGAFCLLLMDNKQIVAIRDPLGFRPLCLGRLGNAVVIASETVALDVVGAKYVRDIKPGEISAISLDASRFEMYYFGDGQKKAQCIFEQIYFADPASRVFGENVHLTRYAMGKQLGKECPADVDLIVPIPHSGIDAAMGFSDQTGIRLGRAFTTNNYTGRSFIMPEQAKREAKVNAKLHVVRDAIIGKRICVVEDSIVRGTTTRLKMKVLRGAGATEVHLRVASPPIRHPCFFGIDFPEKDKLIAHNKTTKEIGEFLGVDSLGYLSIDSMLSCVAHREDYCTACFSGNYPIKIDNPMDKHRFEDNDDRLHSAEEPDT